ncbi:heme-binding protein [Arthrobacter sp. Y81]|uniref:heme-binding protein n=1 Tax=Arthrobacter sp. Y81 TaxID=2058897 RepID=UPI000CE2DD1F|nr:heme-binding protein [Arthrobacter sp. Y81]
MTDSARLAELKQHEEELVFASFDHHDAWRLGSLIANRAITEGHAVAIDKSASALRFEHSTALLTEQFTDYDPTQGGWLAPEDYTLAGGSFPIRVRGTGVVAAVTASGLSSDDDHQLVVDSIGTYLKEVAA